MAEAKPYQVLWTHTAQQDLSEIINYIAQDSVDEALAIMGKLETKASLLITLPNRGRIVPELLHTGISQYRELVSAPWRIVYRIENRQVLIMAVLDSRRDLQTVLLNRLAR
ncbi:MAG: plasmid stabilization protein [Gallionellales bacterium GWA2_60_142]|nr:MAG: plasmid stabilization protein [Gallionellales bacterium GWA2_60_142]HCI13352.1 plasmid stabilization protein [Gallionellaceae bacterium]